MKNWLETFLGNLSLRKKIYGIVVIVVSVLLLIINSMLIYLVKGYCSIIYNKTADNMVMASSVLESELDDIKKWMFTITTDLKIQSSLLELKKNPDMLMVGNNNKIFFRLGDYTTSLRDHSVSFLMVTNGDFITNCNIRERVTMGQKDVIDLLDGLDCSKGPKLVTNYKDNNGLMMVQEIRRIEGAKLDVIGYLIIGIDKQDLLHKVELKSNQSATNYYSLYSKGVMLYSNLHRNNDDNTNNIREIKHPYEIISIDGKKYFAVKKQMDGYELCLYSFVLYDSIFQLLNLIKLIIVLTLIVIIVVTVLITKKTVSSIVYHFDSLILKMKLFDLNEKNNLQVVYNYKQRHDEIGVLHQNFDKMEKRISHLVTVNYRNELLLNEAKYKALENQINPHFLYNTLESINYRAKASGQKDISSMTEALGNLLHTSLSKSSKLFTIREELDFLNAYITIQQYRFEEQLKFQIDVPVEYYQQRVPRLTIQPLVDNAVKYGLEESIDQCCVMLHIFKQGTKICIEVKNSGSRFDEKLIQNLMTGKQKTHGNGVGIINIHKRIQIQYGSEYGITVKNIEHMACITATVPYQQEEHGGK